MKVDIIIPYHGQYDKVYRLMKSIWVGTKSNPYQIYLIDDCSPNDAFITSFEKAPYTKIRRNEEQLGFGGSLAVGYNASENDFLVFLHSDCTIEDPHWLGEMLKTYMALQRYKVGLVTARTNNPGEDVNKQLYAKKTDKGKDVILDEGSVSLYCALCHRNLFNIIRGFIRPYPYGYYEDEELAHRMRKFGLKQAIAGRSWVNHEGGATFNALTQKKPEIKKIIEANREKCIADIQALGK